MRLITCKFCSWKVNAFDGKQGLKIRDGHYYSKHKENKSKRVRLGGYKMLNQTNKQPTKKEVIHLS